MFMGAQDADMAIEEAPPSSSNSSARGYGSLTSSVSPPYSKDAIVTISEEPMSSSSSVTFNDKGSYIDEKDGSHFNIDESLSGSRGSSLRRSFSRYLPKPPTTISNFFGRTSNLIHEWTPFLLVATYFLTSIFAYMLFPFKLIEIFWFIYNFTNFAIAASTALEAFMALAPNQAAREAVNKAEAKGWTFPTPDDELLILDLVIVAYLPNEKDIILDRIRYAVEEIVYPKDKIRINIVYNTPKPIEPLESQLWVEASKYSQLRIIKVENSTSKADNLNYFLSLETGADITAVFDCDHYPHPHNPRWAVERFIKGGFHKEKPDIDIVQGRCVVFNTGASFLAGMIGVEFDKIYAVSHPGRAAIWGFGLFCGSNGYWRTELLRELKMDGDMLTEDIDSALRACGQGLTAVHELNCVSYELAPTTWSAFWKQRLRWAQGWAQATIKHSVLTFNKAKEGKRPSMTRVGLLNLLFVRELAYYLVTQFFCLVFSVIVLNFPRTAGAFWTTIFFQYPVSEWMFFFS